MENAPGIIAVIAIIIMTIVNLHLYHKMFKVVYFDLGRGLFMELFFACFIAVIEVALFASLIKAVFSGVLKLLGVVVKIVLIIAAVSIAAFLIWKIVQVIKRKVNKASNEEASNETTQNYDTYAQTSTDADNDPRFVNPETYEAVPTEQKIEQETRAAESVQTAISKIPCRTCGKLISQGAAFCPSCGSKVAADDTAQQETVSTSDGSMQPVQPYPQAMPMNAAKKGKSLKLLLIIGAIILGVVLFVTIALALLGMFIEDNSSRDSSENSSVSLSKTYTNEEEGISFQYPSAWKEDDPEEYYNAADARDSLVVLAHRTDRVLDSIIGVSKFLADKETIEGFFVDDEEFVAAFDDDISVLETSIVKIDGVKVRKIAYVQQDGLYYLTYVYGIGRTLYRIDFVCNNDQKGSFERFFDAIMESYTITAPAVTSSSSDTVTPSSSDTVTQSLPDTVTPPSPDTVTEAADHTLFAEALWNLILYNTLPDGNIANDLDGKIDGMWDKFAICDIDQDGTDELLIKIGSGSEAAQGQYIYQANADNTGLDMLYSFYTDATYYDTGFIKEDWSHNQGLSQNFWPYSILQWEWDGCREVAGADAWEKMAWETDFSGRPFPDELDADGNGIVYFIGGENGIDYDNPVDDAEYNAFVKEYFSAGNEIYVPWRDITEENIEIAIGYE